jgi:hypothetical protein
VSSNHRGVFLVGHKQTNQIETVQVLDHRDGKLSPMALATYSNRGIGLEYKTLPWEEDANAKAAMPKRRSNQTARGEHRQ